MTDGYGRYRDGAVLEPARQPGTADRDCREESPPSYLTRHDGRHAAKCEQGVTLLMRTRMLRTRLTRTNRASVLRSAGRNHGAVLIGVLVFIALTAVLLSGIAQYVTGNYRRSMADADSANALNLAYAGINYELQKISVSPTTADEKYTSSGTVATVTPYTIAIPGQAGSTVPGQFTVTVCASSTADPNGVNPSTPWTAGGAAVIQATGTSHPGTNYSASRTVQIFIQGNGVFNFNPSFIEGSVSTTSGSQVILSGGDMGSNCPVPTTASSFSPTIYGHLCFHGCTSATAPGATCTQGISYQPDSQYIPTSSQCADSCVKTKTGSCATGAGLTWICNNNDNSNIKCFAWNDAYNVTTPPTSIRTKMGCTTSTVDTNNILPNCTSDGNSGDKTSGNRYCYAAATYSFTSPSKSCSQAAQGCYGKQCMILEGSSGAGNDYYFEHLNCGSGQCILVDNALGPVRIWIGNVSGSWNSWEDDYISCPIFFTSTDPTKCRIYYCKPNTTLHCAAEMNLYASVNSYCGTSTSGCGTGSVLGNLQCSSNCRFSGALICGNLSCTGNTTVCLPTNNVGIGDQCVSYQCTSQCSDTCPAH